MSPSAVCSQHALTHNTWTHAHFPNTEEAYTPHVQGILEAYAFLTMQRKPTFHMFKGIPEGHFSYAFASASVSIALPAGKSDILGFLLLSVFPSSCKLNSVSSGFSSAASSSESDSTSLSFSPGGNSPLHIFSSRRRKGKMTSNSNSSHRNYFKNHNRYPRRPVCLPMVEEQSL